MELVESIESLKPTGKKQISETSLKSNTSNYC